MSQTMDDLVKEMEDAAQNTSETNQGSDGHKKTFEELMKEMGDAPVTHESDDPKSHIQEDYTTLMDMSSILTLLARQVMQQKRPEQDLSAKNGQASEILAHYSEDEAQAIYGVLTGPLMGYFTMSAMENQTLSKRATLDELKNMKPRDLFGDLGQWIGDTIFEIIKSDFRNQVLGAPSGSLPTVARVAKSGMVRRETRSGADQPQDKQDEVYTPVLKVIYFKMTQQSSEGLKQHDGPLALAIEIVSYDAVADVKRFRTDRSKFDAIFQKLSGEQNVADSSMAK